MKKIKLFSVILITMLIGVCFSACSQPSATPPVVYSVDPFAGTKWYGDTKDFFDGDLKDVELLRFETVASYGFITNRCWNVNDLYFGGKSGLRLTKNQKIPYTVTPTATGGFEATIDFIISYKVVISSATATTGYIVKEYNGEELKIAITKK